MHIFVSENNVIFQVIFLFSAIRVNYSYKSVYLQLNSDSTIKILLWMFFYFCSADEGDIASDSSIRATYEAENEEVVPNQLVKYTLRLM